mmetsp:Transcript_2702/g.7401  ORF Transcript_2702/g.7401 Transcript_2702/m.7401 type:complete len:224 (+) Transcript_2702:493-1164(+)
MGHLNRAGSLKMFPESLLPSLPSPARVDTSPDTRLTFLIAVLSFEAMKATLPSELMALFRGKLNEAFDAGPSWKPFFSQPLSSGPATIFTSPPLMSRTREFPESTRITFSQASSQEMPWGFPIHPKGVSFSRKVETIPVSRSTFLTTLFPASATRRNFPDPGAATATGWLNRASFTEPLIRPGSPAFPATVLVLPVSVFTRRMQWFSLSATNRCLPSAVRARP